MRVPRRAAVQTCRAPRTAESAGGILRLDASLAEPIGERPYDVRRASAVELVEGEGEAHAYVVHLEPGGEIAAHEAGFGQLFVALSGSGWVAGGDGERVPSRRARRRSSGAARCTRRAARPA